MARARILCLEVVWEDLLQFIFWVGLVVARLVASFQNSGTQSPSPKCTKLAESKYLWSCFCHLLCVHGASRLVQTSSNSKPTSILHFHKPSLLCLEFVFAEPSAGPYFQTSLFVNSWSHGLVEQVPSFTFHNITAECRVIWLDLVGQ